MYAKSTRPSAKCEVQKERSATSNNSGVRSATIKSRALGALKLASEASCARWECARQADRFFKINFRISWPPETKIRIFSILSVRLSSVDTIILKRMIRLKCSLEYFIAAQKVRTSFKIINNTSNGFYIIPIL